MPKNVLNVQFWPKFGLKTENSGFWVILADFLVFWGSSDAIFCTRVFTRKPSVYRVFCQVLTNSSLARIAQNRENKSNVGWGEYYRKEIELSVQKTQNGILPTPNSALKIGPHLHLRTMGWGGKQAVLPPRGGFAFAPGA